MTIAFFSLFDAVIAFLATNRRLRGGRRFKAASFVPLARYRVFLDRSLLFVCPGVSAAYNVLCASEKDAETFGRGVTLVNGGGTSTTRTASAVAPGAAGVVSSGQSYAFCIFATTFRQRHYGR
jgi:hypothetical protein